jgi:hypothetical protein
LPSTGIYGNEEVFDSQIPTFKNSSDLTEKLKYYLTHDTARIAKIQQLRQIVLKEHSYRKRAEQFRDILTSVGLDIHDQTIFTPPNEHGTETDRNVMSYNDHRGSNVSNMKVSKERKD